MRTCRGAVPISRRGRPAPPARADRAGPDGKGLTLSLRARLLAGLVTVVLAGLLVADVATYEALQSFLCGRVNQQLRAAQLQSADYLVHGGDGHESSAGIAAALPPGSFAEVLAADGTVIRQQTFALGKGSTPRPVLPRPLPSAAREPALMTVPGTGGVARDPVLGAALAGPRSGGPVLAIPLSAGGSTPPPL